MADPSKYIADNGRDFSHLAPHSWVKGQSGNPKGGPKKERILGNYIKAQLGCMCSSVAIFTARACWLNLDPNTTTIGQLVAAITVERSVNGEAMYMRELFDRSDGKVVTPIEVDDAGVTAAEIRKTLQSMHNLNNEEKSEHDNDKKKSKKKKFKKTLKKKSKKRRKYKGSN